MVDLIDRQAAIDFIDAGHLVNPNEPRWSDNEVVNFLKSRPSAQPNLQPTCNQLATDCISRQAAIKAIEDLQDCYNGFSDTYDKACIIGVIEEIPTAQVNTPIDTPTDTISRQAAIDVLEWFTQTDTLGFTPRQIVEALPSAQPTLYGYSIEHLALIARVMQKENVTPEKAIECFKDIGRIVQMIMDEQEEMIRRAVEKWTI